MHARCTLVASPRGAAQPAARLNQVPLQTPAHVIYRASQELDSLACLAHLPTWPTLQELRLCEHPSSVTATAEYVALLAAAPSLRRLAFYSPAAEQEEERQRMQVRFRLAEQGLVEVRGEAAGENATAGQVTLRPSAGGPQVWLRCFAVALSSAAGMLAAFADTCLSGPTAAGAAAGATRMRSGHIPGHSGLGGAVGRPPLSQQGTRRNSTLRQLRHERQRHSYLPSLAQCH